MPSSWQDLANYAAAIGLTGAVPGQYADEAAPNVDNGIWQLGTARNWIKARAIEYGQIVWSDALPDPYTLQTGPSAPIAAPPVVVVSPIGQPPVIVPSVGGGSMFSIGDRVIVDGSWQGTVISAGMAHNTHTAYTIRADADSQPYVIDDDHLSLVAGGGNAAAPPPPAESFYQALYDYCVAIGLTGTLPQQYASQVAPNVDNGTWPLGTARNWIKTQAINGGQIVWNTGLPDPYTLQTVAPVVPVTPVPPVVVQLPGPAQPGPGNGTVEMINGHSLQPYDDGTGRWLLDGTQTFQRDPRVALAEYAAANNVAEYNRVAGYLGLPLSGTVVASGGALTVGGVPVSTVLPGAGTGAAAQPVAASILPASPPGTIFGIPTLYLVLGIGAWFFLKK